MRNCIKNNRGWSLPELLVVLGIVGIASAIAFPTMIATLPKWNANSVTRDVSAKLNLARLRAVKNNDAYGVDFYTLADRDSFEVKKSNGGSWDSEGFLGFGSANVDVVPAANCDMSGTDRAQFNPNGTAGPCNSIQVKTKDNSWIRKLTINTNTGKVTVIYCEQGGC